MKLLGGGWSLPELPAAYNFASDRWVFAASTAVGGPSLVQGTRTSQVYRAAYIVPREPPWAHIHECTFARYDPPHVFANLF